MNAFIHPTTELEIFGKNPMKPIVAVIPYKGFSISLHFELRGATMEVFETIAWEKKITERSVTSYVFAPNYMPGAVEATGENIQKVMDWIDIHIGFKRRVHVVALSSALMEYADFYLPCVKDALGITDVDFNHLPSLPATADDFMENLAGRPTVIPGTDFEPFEQAFMVYLLSHIPPYTKHWDTRCLAGVGGRINVFYDFKAYEHAAMEVIKKLRPLNMKGVIA